MAKNRLDDTFSYLRQRAEAGDLPNVRPNDIDGFRAQVEANDTTRRGKALSLGWSRFDSTRPGESVRHAIRGYLLASIYSADILPTATAAAAALVKMQPDAWLHTQTASRLCTALGLTDPKNLRATTYALQALGGGAQYARGSGTLGALPLEQMMENQGGNAPKTAIVLIDMQSSGDVGQYRHYGGTTVLAHQQAVLRKAAELHWIVYDIVIDTTGANEWDKPSELKNLSPDEKLAIVTRQRRDSYADRATIKTNGLLRAAFAGAQVRHIPKPSHPSFMGTLFAEHLEADGIQAAIVMGYNANQCIKATVFGCPEAPVINRPYTVGLLDKGIEVITARCVLASDGAPLEVEWDVLAGYR